MKSSTVRRSALSRESMDILENLSQTQTDYSQNSETNDYTPSEYHREAENNSVDSKSKEIDLLWQSFKSAQFNTKSPVMHWIGGFILGVITTVVAISLWGMFAANSDSSALKNKMPILNTNTETQKIADDVGEASTMVNEQRIPADEVDTPVAVAEEKVADKKSEKTSKEEKTAVKSPVKTKKYIIKNGDTVEAIIKRNYGSYTPERAEAIMRANNLKDLDHISIDQELLLPIEK